MLRKTQALMNVEHFSRRNAFDLRRRFYFRHDVKVVSIDEEGHNFDITKLRIVQNVMKDAHSETVEDLVA